MAQIFPTYTVDYYDGVDGAAPGNPPAGAGSGIASGISCNIFYPPGRTAADGPFPVVLNINNAGFNTTGKAAYLESPSLSIDSNLLYEFAVSGYVVIDAECRYQNVQFEEGTYNPGINANGIPSGTATVDPPSSVRFDDFKNGLAGAAASGNFNGTVDEISHFNNRFTPMNYKDALVLLQFIKINAGTYGFDADKICIGGRSGGGVVASYCAFLPDYRQLTSNTGFDSNFLDQDVNPKPHALMTRATTVTWLEGFSPSKAFFGFPDATNPTARVTTAQTKSTYIPYYLSAMSTISFFADDYAYPGVSALSNQIPVHITNGDPVLGDLALDASSFDLILTESPIKPPKNIDKISTYVHDGWFGHMLFKRLKQYDFDSGSNYHATNSRYNILCDDQITASSTALSAAAMSDSEGGTRLSAYGLDIPSEAGNSYPQLDVYPTGIFDTESAFITSSVEWLNGVFDYSYTPPITPKSSVYPAPTFIETYDASGFTSRNDTWSTRFGDTRQKIMQMTRARHNVSFVYRELLRTMIASFNDIGYFDSENSFRDVRVIHGNAERAIAKLKEENNIILPLISVVQTVTKNDKTRSKTEGLLVSEKVWNEKKQRADRVLSFAPRPVNINYELNIWSKYMSDMDQILEQIRLKFNPEMEVPTKFGTITKASLEDEDNVGLFTAADKEDRILKKKLNINVRTYIPNPKFLVTSTGEIVEFNVEGSFNSSEKL